MDEKEIIDEAVERLRDMASAHQDLDPEARELMSFLDGELPGDGPSPPGWITKDGATVSREVKYRIEAVPQETHPGPTRPASTEGEQQPVLPAYRLSPWPMLIVLACIVGLLALSIAGLGPYRGDTLTSYGRDSFWVWGVGAFIVAIIFYRWFRRRLALRKAETAAREAMTRPVTKRTRPAATSVQKRRQENNEGRKRNDPAERFARAVAAKKPKYETTVFKCLADYRTCASSRENDKVCVALMAICMAQQIVPFVGKDK